MSIFDKYKITVAMVTKCFKLRKAKNTFKTILVIFGGAIGDSILFFDFFPSLVDLYQSKGYNVIFMSDKNVEGFVNSVRDDVHATVIGIDKSRYMSDYGYFKEINARNCSLNADTAISPLPGAFADMLMAGINAPCRVEVSPSIKIPGMRGLFHRLARYNRQVLVSEDSFAMARYKALLENLGALNFRSQITRLPAHEVNIDFAPLKPYILLSATASEKQKAWQFEKFMACAKYMLENTGFNILLASGSEGEGLLRRAKGFLPKAFHGRVIDYAGKTTCPEWVELVRNATLCLGNDSGSVHVAAHVGAPYVSIASAIGYPYAFPYKLDEASCSGRLPAYVWKRKECAGCAVKSGGYRAKENKACAAELRRTGTYQCVNEISADEAISVIKEELTLNLETKRA